MGKKKLRCFKLFKDLDTYLETKRLENKSITLVPTMGCLHQGHLSCVKAATSDVVVVSIYVNPLQFKPSEDFKQYPRNLSKDLDLLAVFSQVIVYAPEDDQVIFNDKLANLNLPFFTHYGCGVTRPGFFEGVYKILNVLFKQIKPHQVVFGQKDFQQLKLVEWMLKDSKIDVLSVDIQRNKQGLALSSRNFYFSKQQYSDANKLFKVLQAVKQLVDQGETQVIKLEAFLQKELLMFQFKLDYIIFVDQETMRIQNRYLTKQTRLLVAVYLCGVRLIDNFKIT